MKDQRNYPRIADSAGIKWRVVDDSPIDPTEAGIQLNISGGGVRFQSFEEAELGAMIALQLQLPGFPSGIIALAKVRWCEPAKTMRSGLFKLSKLRTDSTATAWEIGCEFHWVGWDSNAAQVLIMTYLKDKLETDE